MRGMAPEKRDLLQGTLDLLILRILKSGNRHGYDIARRIHIVSGEVLTVGQGSLYPALHRLEKKGFLRAIWQETETGRNAKFYSLTPEGRTRAEQVTEYWREFTEAINLILEKA